MKIPFLNIFSSLLLLFTILSFTFAPKLPKIKIEIRNIHGDTLSKCDCNVESRFTAIHVRIWPTKESLLYDKLNIDLVKPGVLKYVRERDGQSYISYTKAELKEAMNGKDYVDVELNYYAYCDNKTNNLSIMLFGDVITGYDYEEQNQKRIKVPVYVGGTGKPLAVSKEFIATAKLSK